MNLSKYLYGKNIIENIFLYTLYLSWLIYIFSIFGTFKYNNTLLLNLQELLKIYISLFLIIKFNPFKKNKQTLTAFEKRIAFEAGIFLFSTTILSGIVYFYFSKLKKNVF